MTVIEITIQRKQGDTWPVVLERSRAGELPLRAEGKLKLGVGWMEQLLELALAPLAYGKVLGKALFRKAVRDAFVTARNESGQDLRTLLVIEDAELKPLHWERLCAPIRSGGKWSLLGTDQRSVFSIHLPSLADRRFPLIGRRDLRALVLVANPPEGNRYGLDRFDESSTLAGVRAALGDLPHDLLAGEPGAVGRPTLDELVSRLTGGSYTLLHIVAHGWYDDSSGETILYLLDESGQIAPVAADRLVKRLEGVEGNLGLPRLTFLATCESAAPKAERAGSLGGLAQRLVRDLGLPAVVAMTQKVSVATATALAREFYVRLRSHGEADRALVQATAGLAEKGDITVPALYSRMAIRPLFSDTPDRELTDSEIEFGLTRFEALLPERAPMKQKEFSKQAKLLRDMLGAGRENLSKAARADWDLALASVNTMSEEAFDLNFPAIALGKEPPHYDGRCPFPGLLAFGARFATSGKSEDDDRNFFFGRKKLVDELAGKLQTYPFLAVLGGSGSGKSSLVLAGLVPALEEICPDLRTAYMTPGNDPLARLDAALAIGGFGGQGGKLDADPPPGAYNASSILVVDQFEELFRLTQDDNTRRAFVKRLLEMTNQCSVVLTMRADFWGDCAPYTELRDAMLAHQVLIAPMTSAELRSAMEQQAASVGLRFEADLSNTILDAVEGEPGAMPLLQHLLLEMWKRRHGRWLRASEYRALGGIQQAISHTADAIYSALSPVEQAVLRNIFVRLTRLDEEAILGQERRDTRRRIKLVSVGSDPGLVRQLVHRIAGSDARLVVTSLNPVTHQEEVEVSHEALIRCWPRLRDWLEQDREALRQLQAIGQAAEGWEQDGRSLTLLIHQGERLGAAVTFLGCSSYPPNDLEATYLEACLALEAAPGITDLEIHIKGCEEAGYPVEVTVDGKDLPRGYLAPVVLPWTSSASASADGARLFHLLFADSELYDAWVSTRYRRPSRRIRLRVDDSAAALEAIPWELLRDPRRVIPAQDLGAAAATPFCRYLPGRWLPGAPTLRRPIKVLAAIANPVDSEAEFAAIESAVGGLEAEVTRFSRDETASTNLKSGEGGPLQPSAQEQSDRTNPLASYLAELRRGYQVFHVVGHAVVREGKAALLLVDEESRSVPVCAQELAMALTGSGTLLADKMRLIILSAPQNAGRTSTPASGFCDLARELVTAGVPAVLIIPQPVSPDAVQQFVGTFYRELLEHGQVDLAANQARAALLAVYPDPEQLPVLFTRLRDGALLGRCGHFAGKLYHGDREVDRFKYFLEKIEEGKFTLILGPGINAGLLPPAEAMADELAAECDYPGTARSDLAQVLEFLASSWARDDMHRAYLDTTLRGLLRCLEGKAAEIPQELARVSMEEAAARLGWAERVRSIQEAEIHHLLAELPCSLYVTSNPDNFMTMALEDRCRRVSRHVINFRNLREDVLRGRRSSLEPPLSPANPMVLYLFGVYGDPESMVLTPNEQLDWIAQVSSNLDYLLPPSILKELSSTTLIFLGYEQGDLALNVIQRGLISR